jgi:type II secretory pathway pseudopilin PulG
VFALRERVVVIVAVTVVVLVGVTGFALAATARSQYAAQRDSKARRQVASWLLPIEEFRTDNGSYAGMTVDLLRRYSSLVDWTGATLSYVSRDRYCIERRVPPIVSRAGSVAPIEGGTCSRERTQTAPLAHDGVPPDLPFVSEILSAGPPPWATADGDRKVAWLKAELMREPLETYWLQNGGSFAGANPAALADTGLAPPAFFSTLSVDTATAHTACLTIVDNTATVSLTEPAGVVHLGRCR